MSSQPNLRLENILVMPVNAIFPRKQRKSAQETVYLLATLGSQKQSAETSTTDGLFYSWSETLKFGETAAKKLKLAVYKKNTSTSDELIGEAEMDVEKIQELGFFQDSICLTRNKQPSGTLTVSMQCFFKNQKPKRPPNAIEEYVPPPDDYEPLVEVPEPEESELSNYFVKGIILGNYPPGSMIPQHHLQSFEAYNPRY